MKSALAIKDQPKPTLARGQLACAHLVRLEPFSDCRISVAEPGGKQPKGDAISLVESSVYTSGGH